MARVAAPPEPGVASLFEPAERVTAGLAVMHPGGSFSREVLHRSLRKAREAVAAGVAVRALHQSSALHLPRQLDYLHALDAAGVEVRLRSSVPFRVVIADEGFAACTMVGGDRGAERFVVRGAPGTGLLLRVYDATWQDAASLDGLDGLDGGTAAVARGRVPTVVLDRQQRLILRILADGGTDRAVAQSLGVTTRTVTRRIAQLYEVLGVESRFQAGVVAERLGLV